MEDRDTPLLRLLHGELSAAEGDRVRRELARDPGLAARYRRLEEVWRGLELPPPLPPPLGFAARVKARVRGGPVATWRVAPSWARGAAAAALAAGLAVGVGLGSWQPPVTGAPWEEVTGEEALAESYWELLAEPAEELDVQESAS